MIRWSYSQWFAACVSLLAWVGAASIAVQVSHGEYPSWLAWPGFLLSTLAAAGTGILVHETRHAQRENVVKLHGVSER